MKKWAILFCIILASSLSCGRIVIPVRTFRIKLKPILFQRLPKIPIKIFYKRNSLDTLRMSAVMVDSLKSKPAEQVAIKEEVAITARKISVLERENDSLKNIIACQKPEYLKMQLALEHSKLKAANIIAAPIREIIMNGGEIYVEHPGSFLKVLFIILFNALVGYIIWTLIRKSNRFNRLIIDDERHRGR